jgi:ParB family chromosome partitioning protein
MTAIISADPFKCRVWKLHDRFSSEVNEHTCKAEIESISAHGQVVPVLGRRLENDPDFEIELIFGARRLFAARHLKTPLLVELREVSDREGLAAMDIENRQREDISPYERGLSYKRWLQSGHFTSQEDISRTLNISASQVSRLLQLAKLPAVVVDAFRSAEDIRENWGLDLVAALDDPERRAATIRAARSLGGNSPRLQGREVIRKLLSFTAHGRKPKAGAHDKVVSDGEGTALFRIRYLHNAVALIFAAEKTSARSIERIETALAAILKRRPHRADRKPKQRTGSGKLAPTAAAEFGTTRYREPLQTNE